MKCLIIDDEPSARARLARLLAAHSSLVSIIGEAQDGLEALGKITGLQPDLIFLDIEMPGLNGFQLLQSLPTEMTLPLVVFITGYDRHALAAFEANAIAYLLKPVETERLAQVVDRAYRIYSFESQQGETDRENISELIKSTTAQLRQVIGRKRDRFFLLAPEDIYFFRADDGIVRAYTVNDNYWVSYQLNYLESCLPEDLFFRAHRSAIVNLTRVKEIKPYSKSSFLLAMSDQAQTDIQVSERQATLLRRRFPGL